MSLFGGKTRPRRRLFLHLGARDTGTPSLQRTLAAARGALAEAGLCVPEAGLHGEGHNDLAWQLGFTPSRPPPAKLTPEAIVEAWHDEIGRSGAQAGVVSSDFFSLPGDHQALKALLAPRFDVTAVLYLQRHDLWLPWHWARALRGTWQPPWGRGYEAFVNFRKKSEAGAADRFRPMVDAWASVVGREHLVIRPYEPDEVGPHLCADFLRSVEAPTAAVDAAVAHHVAGPQRPSFELMHLVDVIQHTSLPQAMKKSLVERFWARDPGHMHDTPLASPGFRAGQVASNFDHYEHIAHRYLDRKDGQLFRGPSPADEDAATWKAPIPFTQMWLVERVCEGLGAGGDDLLALLKQLPAR